MTYKRWIVAAQELFEIETEISREDFEMLWSECTAVLDKTRCAKTHPSGDWVVDFMRSDAGGVYFVLAEVEMPRGILAPPSIPGEIAGHVVYIVDASDGRFTSKRLTDIEHATSLYH